MHLHTTVLPEWMSRWLQRRNGAAPTSTLASRVEVCPPQLWPSSLGWRAQLRRLFNASRWVPASARPVNRLTAAKGEFLMQLADLPGDQARQLAERIGRARSLRELWHLRMATYGAVARATSQAEAERRLAELNRHFPTRTARASAYSTALAPVVVPLPPKVVVPPAPPRTVQTLSPADTERANASTSPAPL